MPHKGWQDVGQAHSLLARSSRDGPRNVCLGVTTLQMRAGS